MTSYRTLSLLLSLQKGDSGTCCRHGEPTNATISLTGTSEPGAKAPHDCVSKLPAHVPLAYSVGCAEIPALETQTGMNLTLSRSGLPSAFPLLPFLLASPSVPPLLSCRSLSACAQHWSNLNKRCMEKTRSLLHCS